jgi:hypothetical protein
MALLIQKTSSNLMRRTLAIRDDPTAIHRS